MRKQSTLCPACTIFFLFLFFLAEPFPVFGEDTITKQEASLEECLEKALQNNRRRPASRYAVEMAEARHRQALAAYWPQISLKVGYQRLDEAPNYIFPALNFDLPVIDIPGVGILPVDKITVPEQNIKLMDKESYRASLEGSWLIYDGGMRKGYREQSAGALEMMKQEARRTDLEIIDSVHRLYFGAVMAIQLHQLGRDTLARMEVTLDFTETMYKEGSGKVKKTDWLDNMVIVESMRSMVAQLEKNELMAQAALANTMGLSWNTSVQPTDSAIPFTPFSGKLDALVDTAYRFNPDWGKIEAGLRAAEGSLLTAKSASSPKVAITGELYKWWNDYEAGLATDPNKDGWSIGIGVEIPIFDGSMTRNKVAEARAQVAKIKEEQFLLKDGLGLQLRDLLLSLNAVAKTHQATLEAMNAAKENRILKTRAYQYELIEVDKVIQAQLMEALMAAQHYRARYENVALQSRISLLVGAEVRERLGE
ncbi:MAG: TolC family protein [Clostridia bacterium]|nr:TolC family protein [Clostridia bacterium]